MARKTRRQKQRSATRQPAPARSPGVRDQASATSATSLAVTDSLDVELDAEIKADEDAIADEVGETETTAGPAPIVDTPPRDPEFARGATAATSSPASTTPATTAAPRRRIERLSQATPVGTRGGRSGRGPSNAAAMFQPLENEDAAIPFDRVPYVPADLRRVLVIALMMVGLIVIAAIVVTHVVH